MVRRHAHQRGDLLAMAGPERGECQPPRPGTHGPTPWGARPPVSVFPPPGAGAEPRLEVIVRRGQALVEPGQMRRQVRLEAPARVLIPPPPKKKKKKTTPPGRPAPGPRWLPANRGGGGPATVPRGDDSTGSIGTAPRAPAGRNAISKGAVATSMPTTPGPSTLGTPVCPPLQIRARGYQTSGRA